MMICNGCVTDKKKQEELHDPKNYGILGRNHGYKFNAFLYPQGMRVQNFEQTTLAQGDAYRYDSKTRQNEQVEDALEKLFKIMYCWMAGVVDYAKPDVQISLNNQ